MPLNKIKQTLGPENYLENQQDIESFITPWRGEKKYEAALIALPETAAQISEIIKICAQEKIGVVSQSGNTGLVLGGVPTSDNQIIINLSRMNKIREINPQGFCVAVEAGCVLQNLQEAAAEQNLLFPLSMASEGSAEIGGTIATNAGGTNVLHYGNMRDLVLGLEVVLPNGDVLNMLKNLRKDNTGYNLNQLFIGSEGTLGIITAACLKLFPAPKHKETLFLAIDNAGAAINLFKIFKEEAGDIITGFEIIAESALELVLKHHPDYGNPLKEKYPYYLLVEFSTGFEASLIRTHIEKMLARGFESEMIKDGVIAESLTQADLFWDLRENISEAMRLSGKGIHCDISLPISEIPGFLEDTDKKITKDFPEIKLVCFGHIGDGNLHYNMYLPHETDDTEFEKTKSEVTKTVYDKVAAMGGSFSAEHGIGLERKDALYRYKSEAEINLMRKIKQAIDPDNIMNPGKVV